MKLKKLSIILASFSLVLVGCGEAPTPEHQHQWGDPTYLWAGDYSNCTATRVCTLDASHVEKEVVVPIYSIETYPTETTEGLGKYTATFTNAAFTTQTTTVVIPAISDIDTYEKAVASISTKHNYSAHLNNQWANETEPFADFNYFNIDNNAMFDDFNTYFYSGYIKQKDQGIVTFQLNKTATTTGGLILGGFVATNLQRSVSDIYSLAVEHLVEQPFTFDSSLGLYKSTSMDAMAILANLAFGDYTSLVSAPEYITAKFEDGYLTYRGVFEINYFDVEEVHTTGDVTLKVSNFGKTHNAVIEGYVANPDYTYTAPTEWDEDTLSLFRQEFNGVIPPFIEGLSYAWKSGQSVSEGFYVAMVEDYFGGNLTTKYCSELEELGFKKASNPGLIEYKKVVEDENLIHTYSVKMKYYAPTDTDTSHMEYGYLYPNGVSSFKFLHKQQTKQTIVTVGLLNQYIANTAPGKYLPRIDLASDTRVANFHDASDSDEDMVLLIKGTNSAFFNIYADTKAHAVTAVEKFIAELKEIGFEGSSSGSFQQYWMSDEYFSQIRITDPTYIETWTSNSYLQVRIEITNSSLEHWQETPVTLDSISVSGQTTSYLVGDTFSFDGEVTATYSSGHTEIVTPTSVTSPDMSKAGQQTIVVSYTNSKGETASTDYVITINSPDTKYSITIIPVTGASISISYPASGESTAGGTVNIDVDSVDEGYELTGLTVMCGEEPVEVYGPIAPKNGYMFYMPSGNVTVKADVKEVVPTHNITYVIKDMDTDEVLEYNDVIGSASVLPKTAEEREVIDFSLAFKTGYSLNRAEIGTSVFLNTSFQYQMGTEDIVVYIYVKVDQGGGGDPTEFGGTYSWYKGKMGGNDTYFRFTFNDDGTGTYIRDPYNSSVATIYFTYELDGDKLTLTLASGGDSFTCFSSYRPFNRDAVGTQNTTGVINPDGSISIDLYNNDSGGGASSSGNYAFRK